MSSPDLHPQVEPNEISSLTDPLGGWLVKFKDHEVLRIERLPIVTLELDCAFSCAASTDEGLGNR